MLDLNLPEAALHNLLRDEIAQAHARGKKIARYRFGFYRLTFGESRCNDGFALNVWMEDLDKEELPHTHIFDMAIRVLYGKILDKSWNVTETEDGDHQLMEPTCTETTCRDRALGKRASLKLVQQKAIRTGGIYNVPKGRWHSSHAEVPLTITLMHKTNVDQMTQPRHLVPVGADHSKDGFDFYAHDQGVAWQKVFAALENL